MDVNQQPAGSQYLFFRLNGSDFALRADRIKEIVNAITITKVPRTNRAVRGVTNIRGELIPVVDLNIRFGLDQTRINDKTTLVILDLYNEKKQRSLNISILVDLVIKVEDIHPGDILPTPLFGLAVPVAFVENMIRIKRAYIPVMNIDTILNLQALSKLEEMPQ